MGRFSEAKEWLRWWTLLGVVVVVTATVDNKPADGYLHSGYYWPKTIYWRGIRHPPGIYWFVFFFYVTAVFNSLMGSIISIGFKGMIGTVSSDSGDSESHDVMKVFDFFAGFIFTSVTTMMGVGLLFISVAAANLSDVVQAYLIGMCITQVIVDALRSIIRCKSENVYVAYFTVLSFQFSSAFGIALLDSYRPLNQLNCAYSIIGGFIVYLITAASVAEKKGLKLAGFIGGLLQMVFCGLSYRIANQVAEVNKAQTAAFFYTALVNFLIVSFTQMIVAACPTKTVTANV